MVSMLQVRGQVIDAQIQSWDDTYTKGIRSWRTFVKLLASSHVHQRTYAALRIVLSDRSQHCKYQFSAPWVLFVKPSRAGLFQNKKIEAPTNILFCSFALVLIWNLRNNRLICLMTNLVNYHHSNTWLINPCENKILKYNMPRGFFYLFFLRIICLKNTVTHQTGEDSAGTYPY